MKATAIQKRWIKRFRGFFGDPPRFQEFRAGECSFEVMHRDAIKFVENMLAEIQIVK